MTTIVYQPIPTVWEGEDVPTVARVVMADGTPLLQGDVSGTLGSEITLSLFQTGSRRPEQAVYTTTLDVTAVVSDTYTTGGYWDLDDTGYNFLHELDGSQMPRAGQFRVQYTFDTTAFGQVAVVRKFHAEAVV